MKKTKIIGFSAARLKSSMTKQVVNEQSARFYDYAKIQMNKIAEQMSGFEDKGNLLDSLCWGVYYHGKLLRYGYYRSQTAIEDTNLHALTSSIRKPINGRAEAQQFLAQYSPTETNGWEVIWAVLAPYWGYWEKGHKNVLLGSFVKFSIMAHRYDVIRKQLKPAHVSFHTYVPQYTKAKTI